MTCRPFRSSDGKISGFVCSRGERQRVCSVCKARPGVLLCDYPLTGKHQGKTCDRPLCARCATNVPSKRPKPVLGVALPTGEFRAYEKDGDTYDLCPPHARLEQQNGGNDGNYENE